MRRIDRYALDANAIREDFLFSRVPAQLFLREARHGRIKIVLPLVAYDEAINLYREAVDEHSRLARRALGRLRGMDALETATVVFPVDVEAACARYADTVSETLRSAGAEFLPYPLLSHERVVRRALDRARPFDAEGKDGYRDTVLWETLLAAASADDPIVLVTGDKTAFGTQPGQLHPQLTHELRKRALVGGIRRIQRITDFTDGLPSVPELEREVEHRLATGDWLKLLTEAITAEALEWEQTDTSIIGLDMRLPLMYVDTVESVWGPRVASVRELSDERLAIELRVWVEASFLVNVAKRDLAGYKGDGLQIIDTAHDDLLAAGLVRRLVDTEVFVEWDRAEEAVVAVDVYNYLPVGSVDEHTRRVP